MPIKYLGTRANTIDVKLRGRLAFAVVQKAIVYTFPRDGSLSHFSTTFVLLSRAFFDLTHRSRKYFSWRERERESEREREMGERREGWEGRERGREIE